MSTQDTCQSKTDLPATEGAICQSIVDLLRASLGDDRFEMWFSHSRCIAVEPLSSANTPESRFLIRVQAESEFSVRQIQQKFHAQIRTAVNRICGPEVDLVYLVSEETDSAEEDTVLEDETTVQQAIPFSSDRRTDRNYASRTLQRAAPRLSNFQFSAEAKFLKAAVCEVLEAPGRSTPFFVHGPTGCGKTHLLEAMVGEFRGRLRVNRCAYVSSEQFTSEYVSSLRQGSGLPMFRRRFRDLDLLAIDDVHFLAGKKATLGEFQQTLDHLVRMGKQVILSSDRAPMELGDLGAEICNRFSAGLVCSVAYPDLEGRRKIAIEMCRIRDFVLPDEVLDTLCERLPRDVRRLSGAINRLHAYARTFDDPLTVEFAHEALQDLFSMSGPACTSMASIEQAVCKLCGVKATELKSASRKKRISTARMLAMYLSRQYTGSAFSEIGDYYGGRSHSTVISADRKVKKWLSEDAGIALPHASYSAKEAIRRLESNLRIG